jgi:precorrin-2 dehydrogenase/sirohydrochlorin ferrochelatase
MSRRGRPQYPVNLYLEDQACVVVGAGPVAAGKIENLLACGAVVSVVAPAACGAVEGWAAQGVITYHQKAYEAADLEGAFLVVTATDDPRVNHQVYLDAEAGRVLVNSADDPDNCRFTLPSIVRRGDLMVAISTRGAGRGARRVTGQRGGDGAAGPVVAGASRRRSPPRARARRQHPRRPRPPFAFFGSPEPT